MPDGATYIGATIVGSYVSTTIPVSWAEPASQDAMAVKVSMKCFMGVEVVCVIAAKCTIRVHSF